MKIFYEKSIRDFEFWSGGADRAKDIKNDEDWDIIEQNLKELYPDGIEDTVLNDTLWFDFDTIAEWLGYESEEHYFYGAAKDEDEMEEILLERFPNNNPDAIREWVDNNWEKSAGKEECFRMFSEWYFDFYAISIDNWIDMVFEEADGTIDDMRKWASDNVKNWHDKSAEEWLEDYEEWWLDQESVV